MENVEEIQTEIVPENVVESDKGDWGSDALELEQQVLDSIKEPESDGSPAVADTKVEAVPVAEPVVEGPLFDIDGKLSVKAGQPLSAEHVKELERGWMRERDYTQKTQQLAETRQAAEQILQASERINQDPKALREYFPAEHILAAFDKREMLNYGLSAAGVPPQMWNQFLEWQKEAGYPQEQTQNLTADPYVQQFGALKQEISTLGKTVQQLQAERQHAAMQAQESAQKQAYDNEMNRIGSEVDNALHKYPDVEREDLLVEMARSDGSLSVEQLAKKVQDRYEARYNSYVERKKQTKLTAPKPAKGQTVKIEQRAPKTFAEADAMLDRVYGNGSLKQRG